MSSNRRHRAPAAADEGIALVAALLIVLLMSALMIGFTNVVMSDQRFRGLDKDRVLAFYGAQSGLEKLTVDVANLFMTNVAPKPEQIAAVADTPPAIPHITFTAPDGVPAYSAVLDACDNQGHTTCNATIQTGAYQGLIALKQAYKLDVVAKTEAGSETHLIRKIETVAIPVFQFGMFSDVDLSFFAGPNFNFGGRVHTNGNLFLAEGGGATLTLKDKVTALKDIVRQQMQNGVGLTVSPTHDGTVKVATSTNTFRNLAASEGSVTDGISPATPNPNWTTISLTTYNGYIRNGKTGAKALNLPLMTIGGTNTDLVRRPQEGEDGANAVLFEQRMFSKVSLRILLSDTATDISNLPTVTATPPVRLGDENGGLSNDWSVTPPNNGTAYGPVDASHPPIARSPGLQTVSTTANTAAGASTISVTTAQLTGVYNSPATLQFDIKTGSPLSTLQTVNCQTVTATNATTIQFANCLRTPSANLLAVPAGATVTITDQNGRSQNFLTTAAVSATSNKTTTRTYNVTSTATNNGIVTNTFWMHDSSNAANPWALVTCNGLTASGNTAPGPYPVTKLSSCNGVPATNNGTTPNNADITTAALAAQNTGTIGGYLKIEMQDADNVWHDVTMEILNWGFAAPNQRGEFCADPTPNAILRLQRLRDNNGNQVGLGCTYANSQNSYDFWPNALYDTREALLRDAAPANNSLLLGGVMYYVTLDVANLSKWFAGTAPYAGGSGVSAISNNGYAVYFSDRRNNVNQNPTPPNADPANLETGEYGWEDFVNPANASGTPNNTLDVGEDLNGNGVLDTYGALPNFQGTVNTLPSGAVAPFNAAASIRPTTTIPLPSAMSSRPYIFRRALKLVNGSLGQIVTPGLTIVTENPVYIQGDWNANQSGWGDQHAATSVIADAVTLLSNSWTDVNSFANPYDPGARARTSPSWYRLAIIAGKGPAFPRPSAGSPPTDFGTDGGAHNFLRYLESGQTVNYQGSIATFYYNRQAVGTYKCCNTVYDAPTRNYFFDTDFLDPAKLPPLTPVFRDVNILGFEQEIRPGK